MSDWMIIIGLIVVLVLVIVFGCWLIVLVNSNKSSVGKIKVIHQQDDEPVMLFEVKDPVNLYTRKRGQVEIENIQFGIRK